MNQFILSKRIQVNSFPLAIDISSNGKYFLICERHEINRWCLANYDKQTINSETELTTLKIFKDSSRFVVAGQKNIQIYALETLTLLQYFEIDNNIKYLSLDSSGNLLITSSYQTIFYDLQTLNKIGDQCPSINNMIDSNDQYIYLNNMQSHRINKIRSSDLKLVKTRIMTQSGGHAYSFDVCSKSGLYAQVGGDMQIVLFENQKFKLLRKFQPDEDIHCQITFTQDSKIISLGFDGLMLIRTINGDVLQTIHAKRISYWEQPRLAFQNQTIIMPNSTNEVVIYKQML